MLTNIGKKLIGDGAEQYLPFALSKLRFFASTLKTFPFSSTIRADEATILLELRSAEAGQITIWAEGFMYEFMTTGGTLVRDAIVGVDMLRGSAVKVTYDRGTVKLKPIAAGSTALPPPNEGDWRYTDEPHAMQRFLPHGSTWQVQNIPQHAYFPSRDGRLLADPMMVDSWSAADPVAGKFIGVPLNMVTPHMDRRYDLAPSVYSQSKKPRGGPSGLAPDADWYKRAAVRTVMHPEHGTRTFIILSDASDVFHAHPIMEADYSLADGSPYLDQAIKTSVPASAAQSVAAPLPPWARKSTGAKRDLYAVYGDTTPGYIADEAELYTDANWSFNSRADRAVAVTIFDYPQEVMGERFAGYEPEVASYIGQPLFHARPIGGEQMLVKLRRTLPGYVELKLDLTLTGPEPADFSFNVSLRQELRPDASEAFVLAVDYAWPVKDKTALDDLLVMTADMYYPAGAFATPYADEIIQATITNQTQGTVVWRQNVSKLERRKGDGSYGTDTAGDPGSYHSWYAMRFLALDLRSLSMVTEGRYYRTERDGVGAHLGCNAAKVTVMAFGKEDTAVHLGDIERANAFLEEFAQAAEMSAGWERFSPNATFDADYWYSLPGTEITPEQEAWILAMSERSAFPSTYKADGTPLRNVAVLWAATTQTGASWYAKRLIEALSLTAHHAGTLATNGHTAFSVHPEGHWSVASEPIGAYIHDISAGGAAVDTEHFKQELIDVVVFKVRKADGSAKLVRTSHLELFNQAYGQALQKDDLLFGYSLGPTACFCKLDPALRANLPATVFGLIANTPTTVVYWSQGPLVRGSSLFSGKLNKDAA